jgi:hypothetical protein
MDRGVDARFFVGVVDAAKLLMDRSVDARSFTRILDAAKLSILNS